MIKKLSLFIIICLIFIPAVVDAVGVSVSPSKLLIESQTKELTRTQITIKNPSTVVGIYDVYVDDYADWIKIKPSSFTLEAGESREVGLEIRVPETGAFGTDISVVAKPLSAREFQANSGIKVPIEVRVERLSQDSFVWNKIFSLVNIIMAIYAVLALILLTAMIKKLKKVLA